MRADSITKSNVIFIIAAAPLARRCNLSICENALYIDNIKVPHQ